MFPSLWAGEPAREGPEAFHPRLGISSITHAQANSLIESGGCVLLDVREPDEFHQIRIPQAVNLPLGRIDAQSAARVAPSKDKPVVVYCRTGRRSAEAAQILERLGYSTILDMGGISSWPFSTVTGS
jgi:phage shock protein E